MDLLRRALNLAMEGMVDGKVSKEIEHVYYVQLADFAQLSRAESMEKQEQWEIKLDKVPDNAAKGKIRVRMTDDGRGDGAKYILTTKVTTKSDDNYEVETETSADMMRLFKFLAAKGMKKDRYHFPVDGLVYEVDVFRKPDGEYFEWVKVDLEVPNKETTIPPFPLEFVRMISEPYGKRSDEDEKLISGFYDNEFVTKNEYL
jgi:CYTH domain-containing protein